MKKKKKKLRQTITIQIDKIICCPECIKKKKIKRFTNALGLNNHLTKKHDVNYKIMTFVAYVPLD